MGLGWLRSLRWVLARPLVAAVVGVCFLLIFILVCYRLVFVLRLVVVLS